MQPEVQAMRHDERDTRRHCWRALPARDVGMRLFPRTHRIIGADRSTQFRAGLGNETPSRQSPALNQSGYLWNGFVIIGPVRTFLYSSQHALLPLVEALESILAHYRLCEDGLPSAFVPNESGQSGRSEQTTERRMRYCTTRTHLV